MCQCPKVNYIQFVNKCLFNYPNPFNVMCLYMKSGTPNQGIPAIM